MTLAEIKVQALNIMFATYEVINTSTLSDKELDENYAPYLQRMKGSINRCIGDIENKCAVPTNNYDLNNPISVTPYVVKYALPNDYFKIKCIYLTDGRNFYENVNYKIIGNYVLLDKTNGQYMIEYYPKLNRLEDGTPNTFDITYIPQNICELIPYFIKGELYREDEPNEASESMNWYEAKLDQIIIGQPSDSNQSMVESVYEMQY